MCCPLDQNEGVFKNGSAHFHDKSKNSHVHVEGTMDFTPTNFPLRLVRFFQRMEVLEKTLELFDESFHATAYFVKKFASVRFYEFTSNLHTAAHTLEHFLHSIAFYGDIARLSAGAFFEYKDLNKKKIDFIRSLSRVFYAVAHLFSHIELLKSLDILKTPKLDGVLRYNTNLMFAGHLIWTVSLVWRRMTKSNENNFFSKLVIYSTGLAYQGFELLRSWKKITPYLFYLSKLQAVSGMIHAWSIISFLLPDQQKININVDIKKEKEHHHHHHH